MLAIERKNEILAILQKEQRVLVSELSKRYDVTDETIRRDLDKLEKEGYTTKTYGGAILGNTTKTDLSYAVRNKTNVEDKKMIKLTVITNSVEVLIELAGHEGIQVISTGGNLNESSLSLVGNAAQKVLNGYHVDKAIFSCKGIDMKEGMTDSNELDSDIKIAMYNCADTAILAVDSSKFDRVSFVKSMMLKKGDVIVTDRKPSAEWLSFLEEQGVHLVTQE